MQRQNKSIHRWPNAAAKCASKPHPVQATNVKAVQTAHRHLYISNHSTSLLLHRAPWQHISSSKLHRVARTYHTISSVVTCVAGKTALLLQATVSSPYVST